MSSRLSIRRSIRLHPKLQNGIAQSHPSFPRRSKDAFPQPLHSFFPTKQLTMKLTIQIAVTVAFCGLLASAEDTHTSTQLRTCVKTDTQCTCKKLEKKTCLRPSGTLGSNLCTTVPCEEHHRYKCDCAGGSLCNLGECRYVKTGALSAATESIATVGQQQGSSHTSGGIEVMCFDRELDETECIRSTCLGVSGGCL